MRRQLLPLLMLVLCVPVVLSAAGRWSVWADQPGTLEPPASDAPTDGGEPSAPAPSTGGPASSVPRLPTPSAGPPATPDPTDVAPVEPKGVPILYYHRVDRPPRDFRTWDAARQERFMRYNVLPSAFEAQLDWLVDNGYTTILPSDLADHWDYGKPLPPKPIIITFDDGYRSWRTTVLPLMRERGMVGEFYVTGHEVTEGVLTWRFLREALEAGFGIGGHQLTHVQLAGMPGRRDRSPEEMWDQVWGIRTLIHDRLGIWPDSMAYVGGGYSDELIAVVQRAGYRTARGTYEGLAQRERQRWALPVVAVKWSYDVVDVLSGEVVPGVPKFARKVTSAGQ